MNRIESQSKVVVLTGYMDCQLNYQGFKATVIADEGTGYRVRDNDGRNYHCEPNELLILEQQELPH